MVGKMLPPGVGHLPTANCVKSVVHSSLVEPDSNGDGEAKTLAHTKSDEARPERRTYLWSIN